MSLYQRILVPVDGSPTSEKALQAAIDLARATGGQLRVLHVLDELVYLTGFEPATDMIREARAWAARELDRCATLAQAAGVTCDTRLAEAPGERLGARVAREAQEWKADLVVLGTHGRHGVGRVLLGSGAEQIIRLALTPVLVIRASDA